MELLKKLQTSLLDAICKNMLPSDNLERDVRHITGNRIGKEEAASLRRDSINEFRATFLDSMREILDKEHLEEKLVELHDVIKKQDTNDKSKHGWRPSDVPERDTFGHRRPIMVDHLRRLRDARNGLKAQMMHEKAALQKEMDELKTLGGPDLSEDADSSGTLFD
ncbi:hypothetical protein AAVH_37774 [Aphelenchoides avenae]|nr:hypothetical protein AAVH_37774 [Aphelenchus avenae]